MANYSYKKQNPWYEQGKQMSAKNLRGDIASKNELISFRKEGDTESFSPYEIIFDRGRDHAPLSRYTGFNEASVDLNPHLMGVPDLPSISWVERFLKSGGSFDSCEVWGIHPGTGVGFEELGIPAEFAGKMLALLGRADYDYTSLPEVWETGICPQTRAEFHAVVRGIQRKELADKAGCNPVKSLMALGWMTEPRWARYMCASATKVVEASPHSFNGVWLRHETLLSNEKCLENPAFSGWVRKRPSEDEMSRRNREKSRSFQRVTLKKLPGRLMAAALRNASDEYRKHFDKLRPERTSVGKISDTGDGVTLLNFSGFWGIPEDLKEAKIFTGRKLSEDLSAVKVDSIWFVWNPQTGFQRHLESASLREALRLWENRSRKGEPRPLCLNEVRNDRSGTAGFCIAGTKAFLQNRMPFVYRLISRYNSWDEIPAEILSTRWEVDFKIFQGYPVP